MVSPRSPWMLLLLLTAAAAAQQAAAFASSQATQILRGVSTLSSSSQAAVRPLAAAASPAAASKAASTSSSNSSGSHHTLDGETIEGPLQPLRGMVLLQKLQPEEKTKGGLLLPTNARQEQLMGRVLATGPGDFLPDVGTRAACGLEVGDVVVYSKHSGDGVKYDGADCVLLSGDEVLARVADPERLQAQDVRPLADTLFVRILKPAEKSAGGLLLMPQQQQRLLQQAVVVAAGPGRLTKQQTRIPVDVAPGNKVLYSTYAEEAAQLKIGDEAYAFVRAGDIAAKWGPAQ